MFETSVVHAQAAAARGRFSLLTVSVAAHSIAILGAIAFSVAATEFPTQAPDEVSSPILMRVEIPPPLGDPNGGARRQAPPAQQQQQQQQQPREQTAPPPVNQITAPDPNAEPQPLQEELPASGGEGDGIPGATSTADVGVPWGTEGSTGALNARPGPATNTVPEEKIYEVHEVKAPVLLHKVAPDYPDILRRNRVPATVVVRCVIDRNGHVRNPKVIVPALPPFNAEVIKAVQQWRYTPGSLNGIAVETYLNVTVTFSVR